MNVGIYMILNLVTEMYYIGQATHFEKRWKDHKLNLNKFKHSNPHLQYAWNKYGAINFKFHILEFVSDRNLLNEREQFWMDRSKCYEKGIGYNIRRIAESNRGIKVTEETKRRMSVATKGRKHSEQTKLKMSQSGKEKVFTVAHKANLSAARIGKKHSEETIKKMIIASSKPRSEETKLKIGRSNKGKKRSDEVKAKMSILGKGRILSDSTKKKISIARTGKYKLWATKKNDLGNSIGKL